MAIGIGHEIGNYRVVRKLGSGGMGAVYLAEHPLIGKRVALKVLHVDLAKNPEVVTRFFNEARAVNQIGNEHIVDIHDFGRTPDGDSFFVMELLEGTSLAGLLERERVLSTRRALRIAAQIADALGAAHAAGILHRDLKPDNVFLVTRGGKPDFVKILDFGLAKLLDRAGPSQLTRAGVVLGTPQYMSPEQCESKVTIDARSDVYALGVLLYHMLTGTVPFDGKTMGDILVQHVSATPRRPRELSQGVPAAVETLILRCLEKRPEDRFQSMAEVRSALLEQASAGRPAPVARSRARRSRAALIGAFVGVAAGLAATGFLLFRRPPPLPTPIAVPVQPVAATPVPVPVPVPMKVDAQDPAARVHVMLVSDPPGAEIVDERTGEVLGETPKRLVVEHDTPVEVVLRLSGYEDRRQSIRATSDTDILVELMKKSRRRRPRLDDGLLEPR